MDKIERQNIAAIAVPYRGSEPYIFISYSHKDRDKVMRVLDTMQHDGYRIWFDAGIDPGTEWDQSIANHIEKSGYFIAFISSNYISSDNCKDEINYARDLNIKRVLVYLEQVDLPAGMAMRLNRLQAIHFYLYERLEDFFEKLYGSDKINMFCDKLNLTFESPEMSTVPKLTVEVCKKFSENMPDYRFVFVCEENFNKARALLSAIKAELAERKVDFTSILMEHFVDELVESIRNDKIQETTSVYEGIPVLIIDGIEIIATKRATQEKIYRLLRYRYYANKPTLILSPSNLKNDGFDERLLELISNWREVFS